MSEAAEGGDLPSQETVAKVCRLLNRHSVRYLVIGGFAVVMHQVIRFTNDVDLLVESSDENFSRIIAALSELSDGAARELTIQDFHENKVVKIYDEVEVDVSTLAWVVTYPEAAPNAREEIVNGVRVPYLGLKDLIRSKQTYRDQDRIDIQMLCEHSPEAREIQSEMLSEKTGCLGMLSAIIGRSNKR